MSRKPLDKYATTDLFEHGMWLKKTTLHKTRSNTIQKMIRKQELIYVLMKYFTEQITQQRQLLGRCSLQSVVETTAYEEPSWKCNFKQYMSLNH